MKDNEHFTYTPSSTRRNPQHDHVDQRPVELVVYFCTSVMFGEQLFVKTCLQMKHCSLHT